MGEEVVKKGVTSIIYDDMGDKWFLILHRTKNWEGWEFVKGNIEGEESPENAAAREVYKETGIKKFSLKKKLGIKKEYINPKNGQNHVHDVFLFEASMNVPVNISKEEHDTYQWAKKDLVRDRLTKESDKNIFEEALNILSG